MKIDLLKIKSITPPPEGDLLGFNAYINSIELLIKRIIPKSIFETDLASNFIPFTSYFQKLNDALPLLFWNLTNKAPSTISITVLCRGAYTQGTGRFFMDTISRTLLPGKNLHLTINRSLAFHFIIAQEQDYFIDEVFIEVKNNKDLKMISSNVERVCEQIRLTLLGVEHARKLVVSKPLSLDEKCMILAENLSSLIKYPAKSFSDTLFDKTHHLILKAYHEGKSGLPKYLSNYLEDNPRAFDCDIFKEMQDFTLLFEKNFACQRNITHLNRTLSYLYFFRKIIIHTILTTPKKRYFSFKLMPTQLTRNEKTIPVLAIIIGTNLINDYERLDETRVLVALEKYLPKCKAVSNIFSSKELQRQRIRTLYLEVQKNDGSPFTPNEVKKLKKQLPKEIKTCIQLSSPLLPPQSNEKEIMRNTLILSKDFNQQRGIPLITILFQGETNEFISFVVILISVQKEHHDMNLQSSLCFKVHSHTKKTVGILNQRHLKEANIFEIDLKKNEVFCEENSSCFTFARKELINYLRENIGEFQDFNGGAIAKQYTALKELKAHAKESSEHLLLESFFYSIYPSCMQCLIPSKVLYCSFTFIFSALKQTKLGRKKSIDFHFFDTYLFILVLEKKHLFIKKITQKIQSLNTPEIVTSTASLKLQNQESLLFTLQSNERALLLSVKKILEDLTIIPNKDTIK